MLLAVALALALTVVLALAGSPAAATPGAAARTGDRPRAAAGGVAARAVAARAVAAAVAGESEALPVAGGELRSHGWAWPLAPPRRLIRPFEAPATRYAAGHRGIDLAAAEGVAILAPVAATVYFAGAVAGRPVITLQPADGVLVSMEPALSTLAPGDTVARGEVVGAIATGGHCERRCLHLGVRVNGEYVSPLTFFGGVPRAVLLPVGAGEAGRPPG